MSWKRNVTLLASVVIFAAGCSTVEDLIDSASEDETQPQIQNVDEQPIRDRHAPGKHGPKEKGPRPEEQDAEQVGPLGLLEDLKNEIAVNFSKTEMWF